MSTPLVLGNHLVPAVLERLRVLAPLPERGILAGQALGSALCELFGHGPGVYNDIDLFVPTPDAKRELLQSEARAAEDAMRLGLPLATLTDYRFLGLQGRHSLNILGSDRAGALNYVWCDENAGLLSPSRVVYSFDLNAVEVALDLERLELTWTSAFERYLLHRELEVTSLGTPERTLLRYFKKRRELGAYGNDPLVKNMVASWLRFSRSERGQYLGQGMVALFEAHRDALAGWFELAHRVEQSLPCAGSPITLREGPCLQVAEGWRFPTADEALLRGALDDDNDLAGLARLAPTLFYQAGTRSPQTVLREAKALRASYELEESRAARTCPDAYEDLVHMSVKLLGPAYLKGQRSEGHLRVVLHLLSKHPGLSCALFGLTLEEQYRCVLDLKRRAKVEDDFIYGVVEASALPVDMRDEHHREQFFRRVAREEATTALVEPLLLPLEEGSWRIRELTTPRALRIEGKDLRHCVGGYSESVRAGRSRILSIRHLDEPRHGSTVELSTRSLRAGKLVRIKQHRGFKNQNPTDESCAVLKRYLEVQAERMGFRLQGEDDVRDCDEFSLDELF